MDVNPVVYDQIPIINKGKYDKVFKSRKNVLRSINPSKKLKPIDYFSKTKEYSQVLGMNL